MASEDLLELFVAPLEKARIEYMITGAVAAIVYGVPRMTEDIDIVIDIKPTDLSAVAKVYSPEDYCVPPAEVIALEARRPSRGHFNIIHMASGLKADLYLVGQDPLHLWAMDHRRQVDAGKTSCYVAPPEYVIIRKHEFHMGGGSDKHLEDIKRILAVSGQGLDRSWLEYEIARRGLTDIWAKVRPGH
ncbi:MAG: hypothetical protein QHH07_09565 [Sedimentisphaerales bacterium]|jgi:hypothetical protein|nr:hypothetical protein [Sedimentisphaerales bacterium]